MRKSKELSINLKEGNFDLNKSGKTLGSISKAVTGPKINCANNCLWHRCDTKCKLSPAAERKSVRMDNSQLKNTKKQVCNELEAADRCQCSQSRVSYITMG